MRGPDCSQHHHKAATEQRWSLNGFCLYECLGNQMTAHYMGLLGLLYYLRDIADRAIDVDPCEEQCFQVVLLLYLLGLSPPVDIVLALRSQTPEKNKKR